jgi:plasmid stabilization system protein ParE
MEAKKYELIWSNEAIDDLETINDYWVERESQFVADKVMSEILETQKKISKMPESHPLVQQLLHLPQEFRYFNTKRGYKLIFEVSIDEIFILRIFHTKQNLEIIFKEWG